MYIFNNIIERITAVFLLFFLFPIFLFLSLLIITFDGLPILFKQKRVGKDNRIFTLVKFRTLKNTAPCDLPTENFPNIEKYYTKLGSFLRKSALDELPQLINIIKGNMSFVGPRPLLFNQYNLIKQRTELKIHQIKPGITGLAQISSNSYNNDLIKIQLDKTYFDNKSFFYDLIIIIKSIGFLLKRYK
jgi:O-antigen biosynthesis protein WbqP